MTTLFLLAACTAPVPDDTDTTPPADTAADTDTSVDTDTSGDTSTDTGPAPLPGSLSVTGSFGGVPFAFACDQDDPESRFARSWTSAVGDVTASVVCTDSSALTVTFLTPTPGMRTDPSGGANFFYRDASGTWLSWIDGTPLSWEVNVSAVTWIDAETFQIDGTLAGAWEAGDVAATYSVQLPCANC